MTLLCCDVDGVTVLGRQGDHKHWTAGLQAEFGITRTALAEHFFKPHWPAIIIGQKPMRPALAAALAQIPDAPKAQDLIDFWFRTDAALNAPLLTAIAKLRAQGIRCALATNQEAERAGYLWNNLGLSQYFDALYSSGSLGAAKPAPAFFAAIEKAEGLAPAQIAFLDDSGENCTAAAARGWKVGHINAAAEALTILQSVI